MPTQFTFQEVKRIQVLVGKANTLLYSHEGLMKKLGYVTPSIPSEVKECTVFRKRIEIGMGSLMELAKLQVASLKTAEALAGDAKMLAIVEAIVSLDDHVGHQTIKEIARHVSIEPSEKKKAHAVLESMFLGFKQKCFDEGRNVMDIVRHITVQPKQCLFSA